MKKLLPILGVIIIFALLLIFTSGCPKKVVKEEPIPPPIEEEVEVPPTPEEEKPRLVLKTINFDFDKSDIRPGDAKILEENARVLKAHPGVKIIIEGHCCPIGTTEYNLGLGNRRASAAKSYLIKLGISAERMETISYGEEKPITENEAEYWKNRRCEFKTK